MGKCIRCEKRGFFLRISKEGLCLDCVKAVAEEKRIAEERRLAEEAAEKKRAKEVAQRTLNSVILIRPYNTTKFFPEEYVVLDFETTGLSPITNEIIEIAALKIVAGDCGPQPFSTLVRPSRPIPREVTNLTGITDDMVSNAPAIGDVISELHTFLGEYPVIAHNAQFDISFLKAAYKRAGLSANIQYIDTVKLARSAFPGMLNYKLATLIKSLGISSSQSHRAMSDVEQTNILFQKCVIQIRNTKDTASLENDEIEDAAFHRGYDYWSRGEDARIDGDIEKALKLFDKACAAGYRFPTLYESYAKAYRKQKDFEREIAILDEAIKQLQGPQADIFMSRKKRAEELMVKNQARDQAKQQKIYERAQRIEQRRKQKELDAAKVKRPVGRSVIQYSDDGTIIKEFPSVSAAAKECGIDTKCIRDAATGRQKHAGGYCWQYTDSDSDSSTDENVSSV